MEVPALVGDLSSSEIGRLRPYLAALQPLAMVLGHFPAFRRESIVPNLDLLEGGALQGSLAGFGTHYNRVDGRGRQLQSLFRYQGKGLESSTVSVGVGVDGQRDKGAMD